MLLLALVWWDNVEPPEQGDEGQSHAPCWSIQISAAPELNLVDQHQERTRATAETQSSHCCSSPGSAWETLALEQPSGKGCGPCAWVQALLA